MTVMVDALIIGAGPAGLMAAEVLSAAGLAVTVAEAKPSVGRKFLMAGKSGLNLTKDEGWEDFLAAYPDSAALEPMLAAFGPDAVRAWAEGLGQALFTGSTGRVFPRAMKASPLLRAWLARLSEQGVTIRTRWRWTGWEDDVPSFDTPGGRVAVPARVTVLALGGASWARLGSDGAWAPVLEKAGVALTPFAGANAGIVVDWSDHMRPHFGTPLKNVAFCAGPSLSRGEAVLSARGLEGGGVYPLSAAIRAGAALTVDLLPDRSAERIAATLAERRKKESLSNRLRKAGLSGAEVALMNEVARPLPSDPEALAALVKALPLPHHGLRPMDEAISTVGGVPFAALTPDLMLAARPGVFCAGEMIDWDAPTGGYLLTACLATGRWAGQAALRFLSS